MKRKLFTIIILLCISSVILAKDKIWAVDVTTGEYGLLKVNFYVSEINGMIEATTAKDANKRIIGGIKGSLAKGYFEKDGSMMFIDSLLNTKDSVFGYLNLNKVKYSLKGTIKNNKVNLIIYGKKSKLFYGTIVGEEVTEVKKPNDYVSIWAKIKNLTEEKIFKKQILEGKEWLTFVKEMDDFSKIALDDAEFIYGFYIKTFSLPFTHFIAMGDKSMASKYAIAGLKASVFEIKPQLSFKNDDLAVLEIPKFNFRANEIDPLMLSLIEKNPKNLIIDVRNNSGGDMEGAMRIVQYLISKDIFGGVMLTQHYWNTNQDIPNVKNYSQFKEMNEANYNWFKAQVKENVNLNGLSLKASPLAQNYKGKIYILTSKTTASSCEPFVYTLKNEGIATIVGEKTAGAVLSMEMFNFNNLTVTIPMLDFYTVDGKRLDGIGVEPNVKSTKLEAMKIAIELITLKQE